MSTTGPFERECFFIAPIGEVGSPTRQRSDAVLRHVVTPAAERRGLTVIRADQIGQAGHINIQTLKHIALAKLAVADLTGANPNVYYELGVRHAKSLASVLIAEETERGKLPFDIAQMRVIFFDHRDLDSANAATITIGEHLEASEAGNVDSPVAAAVGEHFLSGDLALMALHIEQYLEANKITMVSFDRLSKHFEYPAERVKELIELSPSRFRRVRLNGGRSGIGQVAR